MCMLCFALCLYVDFRCDLCLGVLVHVCLVFFYRRFIFSYLVLGLFVGC